MPEGGRFSGGVFVLDCITTEVVIAVEFKEASQTPSKHLRIFGRREVDLLQICALALAGHSPLWIPRSISSAN